MHHLPRFMRVRLLLMALAPSAPIFAWLIIKALWLSRARTDFRLELGFMIVYVLWTAFFIVYATRWRRRLRRRVAEIGGRLCFRCGYGLHGLDDDGICPECGEAYVLVALRERWIASGLCSREDLALSAAQK